MMGISLLDEPLLRSLLDENISFHEVMSTHNIQTQVAFNLSSNIKGFVYVSRRGNYYIILNGNLNYEMQCSTLVHEIKHIVQDLPTMSYYIGIDMQHCEIEDDADILNILLG